MYLAEAADPGGDPAGDRPGSPTASSRFAAPVMASMIFRRWPHDWIAISAQDT